MRFYPTTFIGGPLHGQTLEVFGKPAAYRALQYVGASREEYERGVLPSMPVQTEIVEYELSDDSENRLVYQMK